MVVVWLLGFLDILTAVMLILGNFDLVSGKVVSAFVIYLFMKGLIFRGDVASFIDIAIAMYAVIMIFYPITIITIIASIYLLQKGVSSFMH